MLSRIAPTLFTILKLILIPSFVAYITVHYTVSAERDEQQIYERKYAEILKESVRNEARTNANSIRKWVPKLIEIAQNLQIFVNNKEQDRPGADPGYGSLLVSALQQLSESPVAARHLLPCLHTAMSAMLYRLVEGNDIKREVDTALVDYTATFPGSLPDAYTAAARLHARIEQLLLIYKQMPDYLDALDQLFDAQNCDEEIEIQHNS